MYVRKKKYPSGNIGIIVVEKIDGKMKGLAMIGIAYSNEDIDGVIVQVKDACKIKIFGSYLLYCLVD